MPIRLFARIIAAVTERISVKFNTGEIKILLKSGRDFGHFA